MGEYRSNVLGSFHLVFLTNRRLFWEMNTGAISLPALSGAYWWPAEGFIGVRKLRQCDGHVGSSYSGFQMQLLKHWNPNGGSCRTNLALKTLIGGIKSEV